MTRRSRAVWKKLMEEHDASDLSLAEFSAKKGVKKESFRWWRKVFRREERRRIEAEATARSSSSNDQPLTQRLVDLLAHAPATVDDLAPRLGSSFSEVENELKELDSLGVVYEESRKGCASRWHLG